jgi:hypothetical protein
MVILAWSRVVVQRHTFAEVAIWSIGGFIEHQRLPCVGRLTTGDFMVNITRNVYKLFLMLAVVGGMPLAVYAADEAKGGAMDSFKLLDKARSGALFYDGTIDFSKYDKVLLFPITRDQAKITERANSGTLKDWKEFDEKEWTKIDGHFDTFAQKIFSESDVFTVVDKPGEGVIAMQFRMLEFMANTDIDDNAAGTMGRSSIRLGNMKIRGILLDATNKRLLAVTESLHSINSGQYEGRDNQVGRNLAWRRSFQRIIDNLHDDMGKLRGLKPVQQAVIPQGKDPAAAKSP